MTFGVGLRLDYSSVQYLARPFFVFRTKEEQAAAAVGESQPVWPVKSRQMSINVYKFFCPKMISLEEWKILKTLQNLPKNVSDSGEIIVVIGHEKLPKGQ